MTVAITPVAFVATQSPPTDTAGRGLDHSAKPKPASGPAMDVTILQTPAGEVQQLVQLAVMLAEAKHHRNLHQYRAALASEARLREFRNQILREGMRK